MNEREASVTVRVLGVKVEKLYEFKYSRLYVQRKREYG